MATSIISQRHPGPFSRSTISGGCRTQVCLFVLPDQQFNIDVRCAFNSILKVTYYEHQTDAGLAKLPGQSDESNA